MSKHYRLFGENGKMEEVKPTGALPMYCKIYSYGFGMSLKEAAVISPADEHGTYKAVFMSEYEPGFTTVSNHASPHSKKFGIGNYYDDDKNTFPEAEVKKFIALAEKAEKEEAEAARAKAKADAEEIAALPSEFPFLTVNESDDQKVTKKNMVTELKKAFPGVKFSVKKRYWSSYDVSWENGPTEDQVQEITQKYVAWESDWSGDYRDPAYSNFNRVFGGFKFVFTDRDFSEDVEALREEFKTLANFDDSFSEQDKNRYFRLILQRTEIYSPVTGIERKPNYSGSVEDCYNLTFKGKDTKKAPENNTENLEIIDYSEKAFAVVGETKPLKDQLKALGGRFNFHLKCGAGWIFPKTKEAEVKAALAL